MFEQNMRLVPKNSVETPILRSYRRISVELSTGPPTRTKNLTAQNTASSVLTAT